MFIIPEKRDWRKSGCSAAGAFTRTTYFNGSEVAIIDDGRGSEVAVPLTSEVRSALAEIRPGDSISVRSRGRKLGVGFSTTPDLEIEKLDRPKRPEPKSSLTLEQQELYRRWFGESAPPSYPFCTEDQAELSPKKTGDQPSLTEQERRAYRWLYGKEAPNPRIDEGPTVRDLAGKIGRLEKEIESLREKQDAREDNEN